MSEADQCAIEALAAQVPSGGLVVEVGSFIDASHEFPWVAFDIGYCLATVKPGGLLCGDDYSSSFPDVVRSVDSAAKMLNRKVERLGRKLWALRMPPQCELHDNSIAP